MAKAETTISEARGGHHCPHKDGKRSHAVKDSCVRKEHGGYCPDCGWFVCFRAGCITHKYKGHDLLESWPSKVETVEEEELEEEVEEVKRPEKKDKKAGKRTKKN